MSVNTSGLVSENTCRVFNDWCEEKTNGSTKIRLFGRVNLSPLKLVKQTSAWPVVSPLFFLLPLPDPQSFTSFCSVHVWSDVKH